MVEGIFALELDPDFKNPGTEKPATAGFFFEIGSQNRLRSSE